MPTPNELEAALWKGLDSDRTVMLGINGHTEHMRPMTAQRDGEGRQLWFFTVADNGLAEAVATTSARAQACYVGKGHDLFACIDGNLHLDTTRAMIDRLWNPIVASWYEGGKDDPRLRLLRFDPEHAYIWEDASSLLAGVKRLLGIDPTQSYEDKSAKVEL